MNAEQAAHLVEDIIQTWPTGVRGRIWTRELAHLDHDLARGIYEHLAATDEKPPSVARFLQLAASTSPDYGYDRPTDTGPAIAPRLGKQIAWQAYAEECLRDGRRPSHAWFAKVLGDAVARHPAG